MKNYALFLLFCFSALHFSYAQDEETFLKAPEGWRYEKLDFPLSFAPELELIGFEEVYFAPGWNKTDADDFWTYAFGWILEEPITFDKNTMENYLIAYYNGLMKVVGIQDAVATKVVLTPSNDGFEGTVDTVDGFFTKERLQLYLTITKSSDTDIWVFRLSPKVKGHPNRSLLDQVQILK